MNISMDYYDSIFERATLAARMIVPYVLMAVLFLLTLASAPEPFSLLFKAPYILMVIYYWSLFRPTLLPYWLVLIAGLFFDLIAGFPLGVHGLLFMVCRFFVTSQRRFLLGQNFMIIWLGYCVVTVAYMCLQWLVLSLSQLTLFPITKTLYGYGIGGILFPFVLLLLHLTHQVLPAPQVEMARTLKEQRGAGGF